MNTAFISLHMYSLSQLYVTIAWEFNSEHFWLTNLNITKHLAAQPFNHRKFTAKPCFLFTTAREFFRSDTPTLP